MNVEMKVLTIARIIPTVKTYMELMFAIANRDIIEMDLFVKVILHVPSGHVFLWYICFRGTLNFHELLYNAAQEWRHIF